MNDAIRNAMLGRAARVRSRAAVLAWEYRQRAGAKGVWYRLRRVLARAERAYVISREEAETLAEALRPESVGGELEPPKTLIFVPPERIEHLGSAREIPVRLGSELLRARHVVLVAFPPAAR